MHLKKLIITTVATPAKWYSFTSVPIHRLATLLNRRCPQRNIFLLSTQFNYFVVVLNIFSHLWEIGQKLGMIIKD